MKIFNGTKSFWINESGKRQYCNAVVSFISDSLMQVKLFQYNQFEYDGLLSTHDHLHYSGRIHISGKEWSVSCKCFMMLPRMLLFGEWKKGDTVHEFCVHANVKERVSRVLSMVPPAA
ncbi:MAG: hypothetical protein GX639_15775 [Fibrobacter sp.]|nr:hypothetical protein [Fibrobacter sp.]